MPKLSIDGVELDYMEAGAGQPLVFIHGSVNDMRVWGFQIEPFATRYHVIAYTRRHYHGSKDEPPKRPPSASTAADDLVSVIEALKLGPAHLAGSSYGGFTALLAASKRPDLARTLVLGEPPVGHVLVSDTATKPIWDQFLVNAVHPAQEKIRAGDLEGGLRAFAEGVIGPGAFDAAPPPVQQILLDNAHTLALEAEPIEPFGAKEAAHVTMPVLLVTGEHTPAMFLAITERLQRLLPHAERVEIPEASHAMHADNPNAYNERVLEFLARHS